MSLHVAMSDMVADALIADRLEQPIEQDRGVVATNGGANTTPGQVAESLSIRRWSPAIRQIRRTSRVVIEFAELGSIAQAPGSSVIRRRHSASNWP